MKSATSVRALDVGEAGQKNHGRGGEAIRSSAALGEELPSVHHGHHQIEEDQAGRHRGPLQHVERLPPVAGGTDREPFGLEQRDQPLPRGRIVFDDEDRACLAHPSDGSFGWDEARDLQEQLFAGALRLLAAMPAQLQLGHDLAGEDTQGLPLVDGQFARRRIEHAQRADHHAIRSPQRRSRVEADRRIAHRRGGRRETARPRAHRERPWPGATGSRSRRRTSSRGSSARQPSGARLRPEAVGRHERHEGEPRPADLRGRGRPARRTRLPGRVEDAVCVDRPQPPRLRLGNGRRGAPPAAPGLTATRASRTSFMVENRSTVSCASPARRSPTSSVGSSGATRSRPASGSSFTIISSRRNRFSLAKGLLVAQAARTRGRRRRRCRRARRSGRRTPARAPCNPRSRP